MRYLTCLLATLCFAALSQTRADEPPLPSPPPAVPPTPAQPQVATTAVSAPSAASQNSANAPSDQDAAAAAAQDKRLRHLGYKPVVRNGITQYCRNEIQVGSRFPKPICGTADSIDRAAQNGKDVTEAIQRDTVTRQSN